MLTIYAQNDINLFPNQKNADSSIIDTDSMAIDSSFISETADNSIADSAVVATKKTKSKQIIEAPIDYNSVDSMSVLMENGQQIVHLYGSANIEYGTIKLDAGYISVNFATKEIYATGIEDSLGNLIQKPHFSEGSEEFDCKSLRYNFVTGKGFVENVVTEQQDGIVRSDKAKMMSKDIYCMVDGKYSTCDAEHPHFYLRMTKGKVIRNKAIITGRAYMVLEDFPIYAPFLPYGYIPTYDKTYSSGVIIPQYGEESNYGFYLKDGGFYWAANDYFDFRITGDVYSKGKWGINMRTNYRLRYKFSGSFGFSYTMSARGERGINQTKSSNYSLRWSHSQDSKANPTQTFSASVDFSSSGYNKENEYDTQKFLENSKSSTVNYRKTFPNSPFSLSASVSARQNTRDSTVTLSLPSLNINMRSINPLERKKRVGKKRFYEDVKISYSAQLESRISTKESLLFTTPYSEWKKGIKHNIPITLPSFKLFNHVNVVPSISYNERWYFDHIEKYWIEGYSVTDPQTGMSKRVNGHVEEVRKEGFQRNYEYRYSVSSSTTLYGMYTMRNPNSKLKAIRHKIDPSFGFSYSPDFRDERFGFWDWVQVDSLGNEEQYNRFQNGMYGSASSRRSGSVNFSLNNNIEMKIADTKDTTSENSFKKIPIFDNLGVSGSYNLAAESFNLSTFSLNARTKIAGNSINISGTLDPYALDEKGKRIDEFQWNKKTGMARLGRLTSVSTGFNFSYSSDKLKKMLQEKNKSEQQNSMPADSTLGDTNLNDELNNTSNNNKNDGNVNGMPNQTNGYVPFEMKWRVSTSYTFRYSNTSGKPNFMQSIRLNGNFDITPKWKATFSSGFDVSAMKMTNTQMSIVRDLHCWTMSFDFSPFGTRSYYTFTIRANASMLQDLKINKTSYDF
jgi:hypothetical protein